MMKIKHVAILAIIASVFSSCDETTNAVGGSLTDDQDNLEITTDSFIVTSRTIIADSVLSRSTMAYLGRVRDPETGAYVSGDFMTQFYIFEDYGFPDKSKVMSRIGDEIVADSCDLRLFYETTSYGDSLATMKLTMYELEKPMYESTKYYSNFDPIAQGYIRSENGLAIERAYTLTDMNLSENERLTNSTRSIRLNLNSEYVSKAGKVYNNYGSYIMDMYYTNPKNFHNSLTFATNVTPGFYFKNTNGLGSMADIYMSQLCVYFSYVVGDSTVKGQATFSGTEEVLQTTNFTNDKSGIQRMADDNTCTYLKTPAGLFTEVTLPVEKILLGHENDTINSAKLIIPRINNTITTDYALGPPTTLLMVPKYRMYSFFENYEVADWKTTFLSTFNSSSNYYMFGNIESLIKDLYSRRGQVEDWDKVVLIPVVTTYNSQNELTKVVHDMSLTSTRLVGGSNSSNGDLRISVIYSKFK